MQLATERRLQEELGIEVELEYVYKFCYQASFGDPGSEYELCSVFLGRSSQDVQPNNTEIEAVRFLTSDELLTEMGAAPERFTPWFTEEWMCLRNEHFDVLSNYVSPLN